MDSMHLWIDSVGRCSRRGLRRSIGMLQ